MINAVPTSTNTPAGGPPPSLAPTSLLDVSPSETGSQAAVIPPQVLPSHLPTHAHKPASAPHTNVDSLSESLANKIHGTDGATPAATTGAGMTPPPSLPGSSTGAAQLPNDGKPGKKGFPLKNIIAALVFALVLVGAGATYFLTQTSQDIRQQASTGGVYPTATPSTPPTGGSNCQQGLFSCGGRAPADCSSHAGQGCYYSGSENTCKCGSGGNGQPPQNGGTCNASGGKATVCAGSTALNICVLECQQSGDPGNSCNYGCNGSCTNRTVAANTCQTYGSTLSCGKWQVDVHGDVSCADSGCSSSGCGGGGTNPTPTPSPSPGTGGGSISATISVSQPNCIAVPGKYQVGSPITFNASGTGTSRTEIIIAKLTAAGNALDATFNSNCPVGSAVGNTGHFCKITDATSTSWSPTQAGKYSIIVNGYSGTSNCSGNPFCPYNAGNGNPITPTSCSGGFVSCSDSDFQIFEVVAAISCVAATPTPTPVPTATPTVPPGTPPAAPMCINIKMLDYGGNLLTNYSSLKPGDKVKFQCGAVPGVLYYSFRVLELDANGNPFNPNQAPLPSYPGTVSTEYTIPRSGRFKAQCAICPPKTTSNPYDVQCQPFEDAGNQSTQPTPTPVPPVTQTACPTSSEYQCLSSLTACTDQGGTFETIIPEGGTIMTKYKCAQPTQICCKLPPAGGPPPCAQVASGARCTLSNLCSNGTIVQGTCSSAALVCCKPN